MMPILIKHYWNTFSSYFSCNSSPPPRFPSPSLDLQTVPFSFLPSFLSFSLINPAGCTFYFLNFNLHHFFLPFTTFYNHPLALLVLSLSPISFLFYLCFLFLPSHSSSTQPLSSSPLFPYIYALFLPLSNLFRSCSLFLPYLPFHLCSISSPL